MSDTVHVDYYKLFLIAGLAAHQVNVGNSGSSLAVCIVQERMAEVAALLLHEWRSRSADAIRTGSILHHRQ